MGSLWFNRNSVTFLVAKKYLEKEFSSCYNLLTAFFSFISIFLAFLILSWYFKGITRKPQEMQSLGFFIIHFAFGLEAVSKFLLSWFQRCFMRLKNSSGEILWIVLCLGFHFFHLVLGLLLISLFYWSCCFPFLLFPFSQSFLSFFSLISCLLIRK